jgi:hypothetical protein
VTPDVIATEAYWRELLTQWSDELADDPELYPDPPAEHRTARWFGSKGASETEIRHAETRLGVSLPLSYRTFLAVTNGWGHTNGFVYSMYSTEEIDWFAPNNPSDMKILEWAAKYGHTYDVSDEDYFVYGVDQNSGNFRPEYQRSALQISPWGDSAVYLLNPVIKTKGGEWEAWFRASWGGADRYRSFQEMMQAQFEEYMGREKAEGTDP